MMGQICIPVIGPEIFLPKGHTIGCIPFAVNLWSKDCLYTIVLGPGDELSKGRACNPHLRITVSQKCSNSQQRLWTFDRCGGLLYVTLWEINMAMENGPLTVVLPIKNGDVPQLCQFHRGYCTYYSILYPTVESASDRWPLRIWP